MCNECVLRLKSEKKFAYLKMMLNFAAEIAAIQAQEQRAKDAKSFRRLIASEIKYSRLF